MAAPLPFGPVWAVPFAGLLLCILFLPLFAPGFWNRRRDRLAAGWCLLFVVPLFVFRGAAGARALFDVLVHAYTPFLIMVWALYSVCGGITLRGSFGGGRPGSNAALLGVGSGLASVIGTTGASILLIRPFLRANAWRRSRVHQVVFFIFLVSNAGGALTALGNPPLFLGFLYGLPYFWPVRLFPMMLFVCGTLLALFWVVDARMHGKEASGRPELPAERFAIEGHRNLVFLAGIVAAVFMSGVVGMGRITLGGVDIRLQDVTRDLVLLHMGLLSLRFTSEEERRAGGFSWAPVRMVAALFAALVVTGLPVAALVREYAPAGAAGAFWAAGGTSALAGNVPVYLGWLHAAFDSFAPGMSENDAPLLVAIASGAVFLGAATYIGNAPTLITHAVAEEQGVRMPSFFGYLARYSLPVLLPVCAAVALIWF